MKKRTQILWNHLQYETQIKVLQLISELLACESESEMQVGLAAAIHELDIWSNRPTQALTISQEDLLCEDDDDKKWIH